MAVKVVQGLVEKPERNSPLNQATNVRAAAEKVTNSASTQQALAKVAASSDAVISSLKQLKPPGSSGEGLKDISSAEKKAEKVAGKIKEDKEEALQAHGGLDGAQSGPVLVN